MTGRTELTVETTVSSLQTDGDTDVLVEALPDPDAAEVDVRFTVVGAPGDRVRAMTAVPVDDPNVVRFGRPNSLGQVTFRGLSLGRHRVTVLRGIGSGIGIDRADRAGFDPGRPAYPLPTARALAATARAAVQRLRSADGRTTVELVTVGQVLWATVELDRECEPGQIFLLPFECAADPDGAEQARTVRRLIVAVGADAEHPLPSGMVRVGDPAVQSWFDVGEAVAAERLAELVAPGTDPAWRVVVEDSVAAAGYPADRARWNAVLDRLPVGGPDERVRAAVRDAMDRW